MKLDPVRKRVLDLIAHRDPPTDLKKASLACGKNHAYLHQFIHRGTPRKLPEHVRHALALHLGIDETVLRGEMTLPNYLLPHPALDPDKVRRGVGFDAGSEGRPFHIVPVPEGRASAPAGAGTLGEEGRGGGHCCCFICSI